VDAGSLVDLGDVTHVAKAFFTGGLRLEIVLDAMREMLGFHLEVRWIARRVGLVDLFAREFGSQMKTFVDEGIVDLYPALLGIDVEIHRNACASGVAA